MNRDFFLLWTNFPAWNKKWKNSHPEQHTALEKSVLRTVLITTDKRTVQKDKTIEYYRYCTVDKIDSTLYARRFLPMLSIVIVQSLENT